MDVRLVYPNSTFPLQRVGYDCRFLKNLLFHFFCVRVCVELYFEHEQGSSPSFPQTPTIHTKRQWMLSAFRLAISFQ